MRYLFLAEISPLDFCEAGEKPRYLNSTTALVRLEMSHVVQLQRVARDGPFGKWDA